MDSEIVEMVEVERICDICGEKMFSDPHHSIGMLHAICKKCDICIDCDEGAV